MGPKCYAVQCIVNGEENPQNCPFPWNFATLPEEDRATAIGNMHKNILVKIARVVPEISSGTLITILRNRSLPQVKSQLPDVNQEVPGTTHARSRP